MSRVVVLALLILSTSCGKVAQPHPPFIRIPQPVRDLSTSQNGYDVVLSWTNPPHYVDGSAATDLALIIIESEGKEIAWLPSTGMAKAQSFSVDARSWLDVARSFTVQVQTARLILSGKSNVSRIMPVDVPGGVVDLKAVVDQHALTLTWKPPAAGDLTDGYFVSRVDPPEAPTVTQELEFKDTSYEPGKVYTYIVTAARRKGDSWILGSHPEQVKVTAVDVTPPKTPTGLQIIAPDNGGAFVSWNANDESDIAGYHLYRGDLLIGGVGGDLRAANSFFDPDYVKGSSYSVSAVDEYGNESHRSAPVSPR